MEEIEKWREWSVKIPAIALKPGWKIKVVPPFSGAISRFRIIDSDGDEVSIYLDCFDRLGCFGEPYWEVYPYQDDVGRCMMADTDELVRMIEVGLIQQKKPDPIPGCDGGDMMPVTEARG
jgi:hypothetical protein